MQTVPADIAGDGGSPLRILLINPNTSAFVTEACDAVARRHAAPGTEIVAVTASRGVPIIGCRTENAIAAAMTVELAAEHAEGCDAVVLAVSFDSGLAAVRELLAIPVVGMSEAAMLTACLLGGRFAYLTFGSRAVPLYEELRQRDPDSASRLMPADRSRITRALEVVLATGRSLTDWHRDGMKPAIDATRAIKIFLKVEREELYRRINARFDAMLAAGALEEVRALAARGLDPTLPAMKAHGVPWLIQHLNGEISLDEAAEGGKRDTRRYTKRQGTWFRHQLPDWSWVAPEQVEERVS